MKLKALTAAVLAGAPLPPRRSSPPAGLRFLRSVLCCTGSGYFQRNRCQRR